MSDGRVVLDVELDLSKAQDSLSKLSNSGGSGGILGNALGGVKGMVGFGLVAKGVSMAIDTISGSIGGAVSRVDTLNQFPKMMDAMGYSSEEAQTSINKLSDGIDGLPTALDEVVATTQQLALTTGDLSKATDLTLALNNAFLSSGASAGDASRGLTQFSQMLSSGKVDMQSWKTLQETMPLALSKTAESFGFTGAKAKTEFYDALRDGDITFDQFTDKLIELNDGVGGFAETAHIGSKGIATSFKNVGTAVTKGVANIITAIDEGLQSLGLGSIADNFDRLKGLVNIAFTGLVSIVKSGFAIIKSSIEWVQKALKPFAPAFENVKKVIGTAWNDITKATSKATELIGKGFEVLTGLFKGGLTNDLAKSKLQAIGLSEEMATGIVGAVTTIKNVFQTMATKASEVWNKIKEVASTVIDFYSTTYRNVFENIATWWNENQSKYLETAKLVWDGISNVFKTVFQFISDLFNAVWQPLSAFFIENQELIRSSVEAVWNGILSAITFTMDYIVPFMVGTWDAIVVLIKPILDAIVSAVRLAMDTVLGVIKAIMQLINGDWHGAWETLKATASRVWGGIVSSASTFINNVWEAIKKVFSWITTWWSDNWLAIQTAASGIWRSIIDGASTFISDVWTGISSGFAEVIEGWNQFWSDLYQSVLGWIEDVKLSLQPVADFIGGVFDGVGGAVDGVKGFIGGAWDFISGSSQKSLSDVQQYTNTMTTGVTNGTKKLKGDVTQFYSGMAQKTTEQVNQLATNTQNSAQKMNDNVTAQTQSMNKNATSQFSGMNLATVAQMLLMSGATLLQALAIRTAVTSNFSSMQASVSSTMSSLMSTVGSAMSSVLSIMRSASSGASYAGANTGWGFYNGLASTAGSIYALARAIAYNVAAIMRSALNIHSPSRVMAEIGRFTGQGLALGIEGEAVNVAKASALLAESAIPTIPTINPNVLMGLSNAYGTSGVSSVVNRYASLNVGTFVNNDTDRDIESLMRQMSWLEEQRMIGGMA